MRWERCKRNRSPRGRKTNKRFGSEGGEMAGQKFMMPGIQETVES